MLMQRAVLVILIVIGLILAWFLYVRPANVGPRRTGTADGEVLNAAREAVVSVWSSLDGKLINQGSGFIVSKDGLILTIRHVLAEGNSIVVKFDMDVSAAEYPATVMATDAENDLALLKIEASDLRTLPLVMGRASQGHRVWALGFPSSRGLDASRMTVTSGIVSRVNPGENGAPLIVQTDAYLTHGSSGGPLYDLDAGGVIGVCGWSQHDEADQPLTGINYAISAEKVMELYGEYL